MPKWGRVKRVLFADDEFTTRKLLELQLRRVGVQCDLAADGNEALRLSREREYGLIILDQYMPALSGIEVATRIRERTHDIPLIAVTGDDSRVPLLRRAGFDRIFIKPLRGDDYINTIIGYL